MHVVYFCCPGMPSQDVVARYRAALAPLGDVALVWVAPPGRSAVFVRAAALLRRDGRIVPELLRAHPPPAGARPSTVSVISFSAGYGFVRELLAHADDRAAVDGVVLLDSLHTGLDADGRLLDSQLAAFAAYAGRARSGEALLVDAHTDVPTVGFASTTQATARLVELAGGVGAGFVVEGHDEHDRAHPKREHGAALVGWGPDCVARHLVPWLASRVPVAPAVPEAVPAWRDHARTLGERAVAWSLAELAAGVCEAPPGSNTGPRIAAYLGPCERDGRPLRLSAGAWCAAAYSAAERAALLDGEAPTLPYRASGIELERDAIARGVWRTIAAVRRGEYVPRVGDGVITTRPGSAWHRHVCRVAEVPAGDAIVTVGGNEGDRWAVTRRSLRDVPLRGFVVVG